MKKTIYLFLLTGFFSSMPLICSADDDDIEGEEVLLVEKDQSEERKPSYYGLEYSAGTFDDVKMSGSYGYAMTVMPWSLSKSLYIGIHFAQLMNYGIVDSKSAQITSQFGTALGYTITPRVTLAVPVAASVTYVHGTIWSLIWTPTFHFDVYKKFGLFAGPMFTKTFVDGSKIQCGFRAGLHWHI
jgi:hypothetical protein